MNGGAAATSVRRNSATRRVIPVARREAPFSALSLSSSAASLLRLVGAAHALDHRLGRGDVGLQHALLDAEQSARDASRTRAGRGPAAGASAADSPAISPHTAIGTFAFVALRDRHARSAAAPPGCSGSYRCDTASSARSTASVYWIRSLVPIDRKSSLREERAHREHRGRDLDHAADLDVRIERHALLAQALLRLRDHRERLVDLADRREHRDQDAHVAVVRRAQDRAQLGEEEPRLGEAEADRAQAQRGVGRDAREPVEALLLLVGAEVERADRDRLALPCPRRRARYASNCSSSDGSPSRLRNRNSERNRPTPVAPFSSACVEVVGQLDVRVQLDVHAVERVGAACVRRRLSFCRASSSSLCFSRYSASTARSGLTMTTLLRAVDDQHLAVADQLRARCASRRRPGR